MPSKRKNFWYWLGQAAIGISSIAVTFSDNILGASFPEHTWVNQMAIPIGVGVKFLWDRVLYKKDILPGKNTNKAYDAIPNAFTGLRGSKSISVTNPRVKIARFASDSDTTLGALYIDGIKQCFVIEDQYQSVKVAGETRIPIGIYKLGFRTENSSMNDKYKGKYPDTHKGMIEILDIPDFTDVYFHIGNDDDDTAGCLLPNEQGVLNINYGISGNYSTNAYEKLYDKMVPIMEESDTYLKIEDSDIRV